MGVLKEERITVSVGDFWRTAFRPFGKEAILHFSQLCPFMGR
jgi:hypothetical protein